MQDRKTGEQTCQSRHHEVKNRQQLEVIILVFHQIPFINGLIQSPADPLLG
jgi:hypothetical protein